MSQLLGSNRNQMELFCLEHAVAADNPVRAIELLVDVMPLQELGFVEKGKSREGRPAYSAASMLKLYLYGYFNRVRSSRRLERECHTNLEAIWLMKGLRPCFRTIAGFRQHNSKALVNAFKAFNRFLRGAELFSLEEVATDGTRIRGQNSRKNNYNEKKIKAHLNHIDKKVEQYLEELDQLDQLELSEQEAHQEEKQIELAQQLDHLTQRRQKYERLSEQIEKAHQNGETQISTTDPDVRSIPVKSGRTTLGFNVVATAESENKLITNFELRNTSDTLALAEAGIAAREALGKQPGQKLRQLADKGFDTGSELKRCAENDIETYVAPRKRNNPRGEKDFAKDKFRYDEHNDSYICPAGKVMTTTGTTYTRNQQSRNRTYQVKRYQLSVKVCRACQHYPSCISKSEQKRAKGRYVERSEYDDYIEDNRNRTRLNKHTYGRRQEIIEHPFGTIKRQWGYDYTLLKGIPKVRGEWALIFMIYNFKRVLTILGQEELKKRLGEVLASCISWFEPYFKALRGLVFSICEYTLEIFTNLKATMRLHERPQLA